MDIGTSGGSSRGIFGYHKGTGDVTIKVKGVLGADTITTSDIGESHAIGGRNGGRGDVNITVSDVNLTTTGISGTRTQRTPRGISGVLFPTFARPFPPIINGIFPSYGPYDLNITVSGSRISTMGHGAYGIYGHHTGIDGSVLLNGKVNITATDTHITTTGQGATGIYARRSHSNSEFMLNEIMLDMTGGSIITEGNSSPAVYLYGDSMQSGNIIAKVKDAELRTKGVQARGIYGRHGGSRHLGTGDVIIDADNVNITTEGTGLASGVTSSSGILGYHYGDGDIDIDARGGSINTAGTSSHGIYGLHRGTGGDIMIDTHDGHRITTIGPNNNGILALHLNSTDDTRSMAITIGGTVDATVGSGAVGVRVGSLNAGVPLYFAAFDAEGYRDQTVTVNGSVEGNAAGVSLAGGGKLVIGPKGTISASSKIAVLATGTIPATLTDPAIKPKLRVDMNLDGRRVAEAIGNDWILNDGGETTIAVNNIVLHEGATGVTGLTAPNGAWNVRMREEGVTVDRTNPANWVISEPATSVVADRDFSVQDFMQAFAARSQVARAQCSDSTLTTQAPITSEEAADSTTDLSNTKITRRLYGYQS